MAIGVERSLDFGGLRRIENLPDPINAQDAATKAFVSAEIANAEGKLTRLIKNLNITTLKSGNASLGSGAVSGVVSGAGTALTNSIAANGTSQIIGLHRVACGTGTTSSGSAGFYVNLKNVYRGNGFYFRSIFGVETHQSDMRYFEGVANNTAVLSGDPSGALTQCIGLCKDSADSNWHLLVNGSDTTKTDAGLAVTAGDVLALSVWAFPGDSKVFLILENLTTESVILDIEITANLPAADQLLYFNHQAMSVSGTTAKIFSHAHLVMGETLW
jgi:hypothetical protein